MFGAISYFIAIAVISATMIPITLAVFTVVLSKSLDKKPDGYMDLRIFIKYNFKAAAIITIVPSLAAALILSILENSTVADGALAQILTFAAGVTMLAVLVLSMWRIVNSAYYFTLISEAAPCDLTRAIDITTPSACPIEPLKESRFNVRVIKEKLYMIKRKDLIDRNDEIDFDRQVLAVAERFDGFFTLTDPKVKGNAPYMLRKEFDEGTGEKASRILRPRVQSPYQTAMICIDAVSNKEFGDVGKRLNYSIAVANESIEYAKRQRSKIRKRNRLTNRNSYPAPGDSLLETVYGILLYEKYKLTKDTDEQKKILEHSGNMFESAVKDDVGNKVAEQNLMFIRALTGYASPNTD